MCYFLFSYRSPSQTRNTFEILVDNLELTLDRLTNNSPFLIVAMDDFNVKTTGIRMIKQVMKA